MYYVQEIGRTGRDGNPAQAIALVGPKPPPAFGVYAGDTGCRVVGLAKLVDGELALPCFLVGPHRQRCDICRDHENGNSADKHFTK
jgi:hypothetical protein